jgi:hypothetical protein
MRGFFAIVIILLATASLSAASLPEYLDRLRASVAEIKQTKQNAEYAEAAIASIKERLPKSEQVELDLQTITIDNLWLHILLDQYGAEKDEKKREAKLDEAQGRLEAIIAHVEKLKPAASSDESSKEKIRGILQRSHFGEKREDDITRYIRKIRQQILDLLRELFQKAFTAIFGAGAEASFLFRALVVVLLGLVVFLALRLILRRRGAKKKTPRRTVLGEDIEEGMSAAELSDAAMRAAQAGDFRAAIRKLYIALLYELSELGLIEIEPFATNRDYLSKVSRFDSLSSHMGQMTERFDYCWYGMFPASEEDFRKYLSHYQEAISRAKTIGAQPA